MLMNRIIGAFTFRRGVYADVEMDEGFTTTAWILVIVVAFLNQLGAFASSNLGLWLRNAGGGMIAVLIAFALGTFVIQWVGRSLFNAEVTFGEMIRTLGLAYVWQVVGVVGALAAFIPALSFLVAPALLVALILGLIAWFVATKEALDLPWLQTIITVVLGFIVLVIVILGTQVVLTGLVRVV
jgi:hypothetical protein